MLYALCDRRACKPAHMHGIIRHEYAANEAGASFEFEADQSSTFVTTGANAIEQLNHVYPEDFTQLALTTPNECSLCRSNCVTLVINSNSALLTALFSSPSIQGFYYFLCCIHILSDACSSYMAQASLKDRCNSTHQPWGDRLMSHDTSWQSVTTVLLPDARNNFWPSNILIAVLLQQPHPHEPNSLSQ